MNKNSIITVDLFFPNSVPIWTTMLSFICVENNWIPIGH